MSRISILVVILKELIFRRLLIYIVGLGDTFLIRVALRKFYVWVIFKLCSHLLTLGLSVGELLDTVLHCLCICYLVIWQGDLSLTIQDLLVQIKEFFSTFSLERLLVWVLINNLLNLFIYFLLKFRCRVFISAKVNFKLTNQKICFSFLRSNYLLRCVSMNVINSMNLSKAIRVHLL